MSAGRCGRYSAPLYQYLPLLTSGVGRSVRQIFSYLDAGSIGRCGRVCRGWAAAVHDILLWKHKFAQDFGLDPNTCRLPKATKAGESWARVVPCCNEIHVELF